MFRAFGDVLLIDQADVEAFLPRIDPAAVVERVFRRQAEGQLEVASEAALYWATEDGYTARTLNMPGWIGGPAPVVGSKVINSSLRNRNHGIPRASGITILFDPETARPRVMVDAAQISAMRTAAVSLLSVNLLGTGSLDAIAIIGAGKIGEAHLRLFRQRLPRLSELRIYDIAPERAERLAKELPAEDGIAVAVPVADVEQAVRGAGAVVTCTTVTEPYLKFEWLSPGSVVINVSLDDLEPDVFLRCHRLVVDSWQLVKDDCRRLLGSLYRKGRIGGPADSTPPLGRCVDAELKDLVVGSIEGRRSDEEVIVVNPFGMGVFDLALADEVYRLCSAEEFERVAS